MDEKTYNKIKFFCISRLIEKYRNRHLEDIVQHVAMRYFENGNRGNWLWYFNDYCRYNGLNSNGRSKQGARTLEASTFVGYNNDENSDVSEAYFLFDRSSMESSESYDCKLHESDNFRGALEEFLSPLNFNNEVLKWMLKTYQHGKAKMNYHQAWLIAGRT